MNIYLRTSSAKSFTSWSTAGKA